MPDDDGNPFAGKSKDSPNADSTDARGEAAGGGDVRINVRVDPDLHERFKARAEREGRPLSWVIRRFMEHYAGGGDVPPPPDV